MKLSGICLETSDVPRLVDFYTKVLCVEAQGNDEHSVLEDASLAIHNPGNLAGAGEKHFILMFEVGDVDVEYERLKALHVEFTAPPETYAWGARAMSFIDPDGNKVDFYSDVPGRST